MIGEQNLWVIQGEYGAGRCAANFQPLDAAHSAIFVRRRLLEASRKFVSRPLFCFTALHELNFGFRHKSLRDVLTLAQSMRLEVPLDGDSWAIFGWSCVRLQG